MMNNTTMTENMNAVLFHLRELYEPLKVHFRTIVSTHAVDFRVQQEQFTNKFHELNTAVAGEIPMWESLVQVIMRNHYTHLYNKMCLFYVFTNGPDAECNDEARIKDAIHYYAKMYYIPMEEADDDENTRRVVKHLVYDIINS